jgi:uncharacterized damage-inducible protein DinB
MTTREFYLERRRAELPVFLSVLRSIPAARASYKPHDRSPSAEQIVWTLTTELRSCLEVATHFRTEWRGGDPLPALSEMLALFEQWSNESIDAVARMDDASWNRVAQFYYGGKVVSEQPVGQFLWYILFDAIHHRGQLTTYLRPMGATVPSIYGPSADSRPAARTAK